MNNLIIAGRIGKDAEVRFTKAGDPVASFSVAVDVYQGKGKDKGTLWVECGLFGERGQSLAPHLTSGTSVTVSGEAGARAYQAKDGSIVPQLTLRVREVTLQGGKKAEGDAPSRREYRDAPGRTAGRSAPPPPQSNDPFPDDDIPF